MSKKISIIAGRCECKRRLDLQMMGPGNLQEKLWTIHGTCGFNSRGWK